MAKQVIENDAAYFSVRYRAVCKNDSYRGKWRDNSNDAYSDAANHRAQHPGDLHVIMVETEQKMSMRVD